MFIISFQCNSAVQFPEQKFWKAVP